MIIWTFAAITLGGVVTAAFSRNLRGAILALWIAGLGAGGIYLTIGSETLAIVQWIVSTLVAISFVFFAVMFGEYGMENVQFNPPRKQARVETFRQWVMRERRALVVAFCALVLGSSFAGIIWFASGQLPESLLAIPKEGNDLAALGTSLINDHLISLEVLALMLFLVLIGGGVVARPDVIEDENPSPGQEAAGK